MFKKIIDWIKTERAAQDKKWGPDRGQPDMMWLTILIEEIGEAAGAMLDNDQALLKKELIQVGAVDVAWLEGMENLGVIEWELTNQLDINAGNIPDMMWMAQLIKEVGLAASAILNKDKGTLMYRLALISTKVSGWAASEHVVGPVPWEIKIDRVTSDPEITADQVKAGDA